MVSSDAFSVPELADIDAAAGVGGLGAVELWHPTVDLDADGVLDTVTLSDADSLLVVTDTDLDGVADELTAVDDTGEFASWRYEVGADGADGWTEIDHGRVGD